MKVLLAIVAWLSAAGALYLFADGKNGLPWLLAALSFGFAFALLHRLDRIANALKKSAEASKPAAEAPKS